MKRIILAISICALFAINANAQEKITDNTKAPADSTSAKIRFSLGLEAGVPVTTVAKFSSFATGVSAQAEYLLLKELGITLNAGYLYFLAKDGETGLSFIPVMGGLRYYVIPKLYLSGQAGAAFYQGNKKSDGTYFTYVSGIGYKASRQIDLLLKYEGINIGTATNYSFAGLRIAYTFGKHK